MQGICHKGRIERPHMQYLALLWQVQQLEAAVKYTDVILTLGLYTISCLAHTPISHVSLPSRGRYPSQREPYQAVLKQSISKQFVPNLKRCP